MSLEMLKSEEGQLNAVFACFGSAAQHAQFWCTRTSRKSLAGQKEKGELFLLRLCVRSRNGFEPSAQQVSPLCALCNDEMLEDFDAQMPGGCGLCV